MNRHLALTLALAFASLCRSSFGQEILFDPRLVLSGLISQVAEGAVPEGQSIEGQIFFVTAQYFRQSELVKSSVSRIQVTDEPGSLQLEVGFDGIQILVQNPTNTPVSVTLRDGEVVLATKQIAAHSNSQISSGAVSSTTELKPVDTQIPDEDQPRIRTYLRAIEECSTQQVVSPFAIANVEWEMLDAYCVALKKELGSIQPIDFGDGWIRWNGNFGSQVYAGPISFDRGRGFFKFSTAEGKLLDVEPYVPGMPNDWFSAPSSTEKYAHQAQLLTRALLEGEVDEAHDLFSGVYDKEVTVDELQELSDGLRAEFGSRPSNFAFVDSNCVATDPSTQTLFIRIAFEAEQGQRCTSAVQFDFPVARDRVSRGHLGAVHVLEAFQSACPQESKIAERLLAALSTNSFPDYLALLHPDLSESIDREHAVEKLQQISDTLGGKIAAPNFDTWRYSTNAQLSETAQNRGSNVLAFGSIAAESGKFDFECSFADEKLLGFKLYAQTYAESSLDLVKTNPELVQRAAAFWSDFLADQLPKAHAALAKTVQDDVPLPQFQAMFGEGVRGLPNIESIRPQEFHIASHLDRTRSVELQSIMLVEFSDGGYLPVRCEFAKNSDATVGWELVNFSNNFEYQTPTHRPGLCEKFFASFNQDNPMEVIAITSDRLRNSIDPSTLRGFLLNLKTQLGRLEPRALAAKNDLQSDAASKNSSNDCSWVRSYRNNKCIDRLTTIAGEPPTFISAEFEGADLLSFEFDSQQAAMFVQRIEDFSGLASVVDRFVSQWLSQEARFPTNMLVPELRTEKMLRKLSIAQGNMVISLGNFQSSKSEFASILPDTNQAVFITEASFVSGTKTMRITVDVNAFTCLIAALDLSE